MIHESAQPRARFLVDYTSAGINVAGGAWVKIADIPAGVYTTAEIYDSSTQTMEMKIDNTAGTGATNVNMYIMPGGNGRIPFRVDGGTSGLGLYLRGATAVAPSTGIFILNLW